MSYTSYIIERLFKFRRDQHFDVIGSIVDNYIFQCFNDIFIFLLHYINWITIMQLGNTESTDSLEHTFVQVNAIPPQKLKKSFLLRLC